MHKVYRIEGESTTRPENLPAGFTVTEESTEFERFIPTGCSDRLQLGLFEYNNALIVSFNEGKVVHSTLDISRDAARQLRDALNDYLGESEPAGANRVFKDSQGDVWVETSPGRFTIDWGYGSGVPDFSTLYSDYSLGQVEEHGPLARLV